VESTGKETGQNNGIEFFYAGIDAKTKGTIKT
jgi:hypothetical protein